jgi:stringent starvation protein B
MDASFKPYLIRAMYEWCTDYGHEPYLAIAVDSSCTVPVTHVQKGQIVLDVSPESIKDLDLGLESISFKARFSGVVHHIYAPLHRVIAMFPTHNQQLGVFFEPTNAPIPSSSGNIKPVEASISDNIDNNIKKSTKNPTLPTKSRIVRVK